MGKDGQCAPACLGASINGPQIWGEKAGTALGFMDGGDPELSQALKQGSVRARYVLYDDGRHERYGIWFYLQLVLDEIHGVDVEGASRLSGLSFR